jgi:hypothetical protein
MKLLFVLTEFSKLISNLVLDTYAGGLPLTRRLLSNTTRQLRNVADQMEAACAKHGVDVPKLDEERENLWGEVVRIAGTRLMAQSEVPDPDSRKLRGSLESCTALRMWCAEANAALQANADGNGEADTEMAEA